MTKLEAIDYRDPNASELFVKSLRETGFGVLKNHPINKDQVQSIYDNWQQFFDGQEKQNFLYNKGPQDGFFPAQMAESAKGQEVQDIKEYFHYYPWGQCPAELKDELVKYYDNARGLACELLSWVEQFSPSEVAANFRQPLSSMIEGSEQSLLRVLHYPPLKGDEEPSAIRAAAHEDINLLTVLPAASEPGLQVLAKNGEWLEVPCEFGNLIINIGDMLQEASGGYFPSTTHRVVNPDGADTKKSRISIPLFLHPNPEVVLSDKYTAGEYLDERLRELGVI
ncbi:MAG: isopenicillin N synthase family dioxygenase [Pseudomonadales bacterium]